MFYMLDGENIPIFKTDRLITCQMDLSRLRRLQFSFRSNVGGIRTDCNQRMTSYLHTETHSWPQLCPVLRCWDTAHRTADPPCPDMYQGDTGRIAPAPHCRTCPRHSSLRRRTQVSVSEDYFVLQRTAGRQQKPTALSFMEDLSCAAGLGILRDPGRFLSHLILRARELNVELLFVNGLSERSHGALQFLLHLLPHTVHVTWVC